MVATRIVSTNILPPEAWAVPSTAQDMRNYTDVEVQIVGTPTVPYVPQRSLDGTTYVVCNAYDKDGAAVTSITSAGIYFLDGGGWLKLVNGTSSTVTIRANS